MHPKVADRGVQCMFAGYGTDHTGDCYRMWDLDSGGFHVTRDIIWLKRMYFQKKLAAKDVVIEGADPAETMQNDITSIRESVPDVHEVQEVDSDNNEDEEKDEEENERTTRSGRSVIAPTRLISEMGAAATGYYKVGLTATELKYYETLSERNRDNKAEYANGAWPSYVQCTSDVEYANVGAGLGGGFENTNELRVMKYKEAIAGGDKRQWNEAVSEEQARMTKHRVYRTILREGIPRHAKVLTSTWAMKKKANRTYRARINARGYEQIDGVHYDSHSISAPVTNDVTIRIVMVLLIMADWYGTIVDVKGAFLHGDYEENQEPVYMEVPEGFDKWYDPKIYVLLLLQTLYGLKQAAKAFWEQLLKAFKHMEYSRSKADPCLYYKWTENGLVLWVSWIDDCFAVGKKKGVEIAKKSFMERFECDDLGNMDEYVGCKCVRNHEERWIKFLQPVLLQSYKDEFALPEDKKPAIPANGGQILMPCKAERTG